MTEGQRRRYRTAIGHHKTSSMSVGMLDFGLVGQLSTFADLSLPGV